jgi:hypothetical protein
MEGVMDKEQYHEKSRKGSLRPIISLLIGLALFTGILLVTMFTSSRNTKPQKNSGGVADQGQETPIPKESNGEMLAVVEKIESDLHEMTLFDIESKETFYFTYNDATDITDKYGQVISASQIPLGAIVDVGYQNDDEKDDEKLLKLQISQKAWEYADVSNLSIDGETGMMEIGTNKYRYTGDIIVIDKKELVPVQNLAKQDMLMIHGVDKTIWSIAVTKGHGTVKLADCEDYLGGNVTVGYETSQTITENMHITVREGKWPFTVDNEKYSATKYIKVRRNEETTVSLANLAPDMGRVAFKIRPLGADLFIDGALTSYSDSKPIKLTCGEHDITVSLEGYSTYHGTLNVGEADKTIRINLLKAEKKKEVTDSTPKVSKETDKVDQKHKIYVQKPIGASIYMDGKFMGISPDGFEKVSGNHVLTLIKEGYKTKSFQIEVLDDGLDAYYSFPDLAVSE